MSVEYKSTDGLNDLEQVVYFWNEKADLERACNYKDMVKKLPELGYAWNTYNSEIKAAEAKLEYRLAVLVSEFEA